VIGVLVTLYGLVQLVYARWFYERRRHRNEGRAPLNIDFGGVSVETTRRYAVMTPGSRDQHIGPSALLVSHPKAPRKGRL